MRVAASRRMSLRYTTIDTMPVVISMAKETDGNGWIVWRIPADGDPSLTASTDDCMTRNSRIELERKKPEENIA